MEAEQSDTSVNWLEQEVDIMTAQLRDLRQEMLLLQDRARQGDVSAAKDAMKTLQEVRAFLGRAADTEAKLAEIRRRDSGGRGQFVLDLDGARASIRCRLDRLRRCQHSG